MSTLCLLHEKSMKYERNSFVSNNRKGETNFTESFIKRSLAIVFFFLLQPLAMNKTFCLQFIL